MYLICENDATTTLGLQKELAALARSEVETCSAGHMAMLSQPGKVVEVVRRAAGESVGIRGIHEPLKALSIR